MIEVCALRQTAAGEWYPMELQATISKTDGWKRTISVTVPATEVEAAFSATAEKYRQKAKIPGFRPGKAPMAMIAQRFAAEIRQGVLETMVPEAFDGALRQLALAPLGTPGLSDVKFERGTPLTFDANFEIRPQVDITGYKGLKLTRQVYEVTDKDVDLALESVRDGAATITEVQRPAREGDVVTCDLQKIYDKLNRLKQTQFDNFKIELRSDRTRPEWFKGLVGMTVGEGKEIEIVYPADEPDPDLAGNTVLYRVWLKSVAQKTLPVAADEFARSVPGMKLESLAELRELLRKDLARRMEGAARRDLQAQARRGVVAANSFSVPAGFLQDHLDDVTKNMQSRDATITAEQVRAHFEPLAVEQFRWDYATAEIAKRENLTVTKAEVDAVVQSWPPNDRDKPDREKIHWSLLEMKVYDLLLSNAQIEDVQYAPQTRIIKP
ncbi:MAG: trigger factor [candidate division Zixibacteria bacterium]|nr:trigger factor [candidate division Zixibacteria bacterium]